MRMSICSRYLELSMSMPVGSIYAQGCEVSGCKLSAALMQFNLSCVGSSAPPSRALARERLDTHPISPAMHLATVESSSRRYQTEVETPRDRFLP
ncbi:hypothetical protein PAN31117_05060 [Pandoraea anapnoica]|uniref:Uncharacterized protein n=1 Tax=Pandoraea anapnoica TaxID=2508301 RepID=A0A5E5APM2_9BURK|nr:hypothetical protein PIN31009_05340 [Pandoraea iniqua]VVE75016.1 hypothetical protein PAN31117_05060 [Pandoraea anapnoica]